jgi:PAS domain S-box-containing protein
MRLEKQNQSLQQVTAELEQANMTLSERADYLAQRNQIISQAVEASGDAVLICQLDGQISYLNPTFNKLFGYTKAELNQLSGLKAIFLSDAQASDLKMALQHALSWSDEMLLRAKDGTRRTTILRTNCIFDGSGDVVGYIYLMTDITQRKETEEQLRRSLKEKEVLLQEIHHRVKNNLQIISSLLYLQSQQIGDETLLTLFKESQNRVKSMSLIHEQLYQTEDLARINFADYTKRLITQLKRSYGATHIKLQIKVETPFSHNMLFLTIERAIPAGLIINELLSNAIKHAFPAGQRGEITVSMQVTQEKQLIISVRDNGVGLPTQLDLSQASSLGLTLVRTLVKQLKGTIEVMRTTRCNGRVKRERNLR